MLSGVASGLARADMVTKNMRYRRLNAAGKKPPVVMAAIARQMAAFLWIGNELFGGRARSTGEIKDTGSSFLGKRCTEAPFPKSPDACMAVSRWSARRRRLLRVAISDVVEFAQRGDDEGDVFVRLMLDEVRGLGSGLGLPRNGPALSVDAVDQDRQQQAVVGVVEVEQPLPSFDVEVHGRVEPLAPRPGVDAAAGLAGEAGRIILRPVKKRLIDPVVDPGDAGKHGVIGRRPFGQDVARQPHERAHPAGSANRGPVTAPVTKPSSADMVRNSGRGLVLAAIQASSASSDSAMSSIALMPPRGAASLGGAPSSTASTPPSARLASRSGCAL